MSADSLDQMLDERRLELNMRWDDVADAAGISYETLRAFRKGRPTRALTRSKIERALQLQPGSIERAPSAGKLAPLESAQQSISDSVRAEVERRLSKVKKRFPEEYSLAMRVVDTVNDDDLRRVVTDE